MKICYQTIQKIKKIVIIILLTLIIILLITGRRFSYKVFNDTNADIIYKGYKQEKIVSFACNIDWGNEYIPELLNILDEYDVKVTFFITGRWADKYSSTVKLIHSKGHEIGNHGYYHKDYSKFDYKTAYEDIKHADDSLKKIINDEIMLFSPPSGAYNDEVIKALKNLDYNKMILWSIDTIDWNKTTTKEKIYNRIMNKIGYSDIILMHPTKNTVDILPDVIKELQNNGYQIVTISKMIE